MVGTLVDRALANRDRVPQVAYGAERSDRQVLKRLCATLPSGRGPKGRNRRHLARALGRHVEHAIRDGDRQALRAIYRRLFDLEVLVSARLALTLRLVDRVETRGGVEHAPSGTPGLTVSQRHALFPPSGEVSREVLIRHLLVLGETGSGKTVSCILPIVAALAGAPADRFAGALIIDPKRQIGRVLAAVALDRLHHVHAGDTALNVMSGPRWCVNADLAAGRWQSAAVRILYRAASFVGSSPARVLMAHAVGNANTEFFDREGPERAKVALISAAVPFG